MIKSINDDLEAEETEVLHSGKKTDLSSFPKTAEKETILITLGSKAWWNASSPSGLSLGRTRNWRASNPEGVLAA